MRSSFVGALTIAGPVMAAALPGFFLGGRL
jgi:hypothetical protein